MSKEPGQMAYEAWALDGYPWERTPHKPAWARVESAIRADESAKVRAATIEECDDTLTIIARSIGMSETLAERLRQITADDNDEADVLFDAADLIEELQNEVERLMRNAKSDTQWLATYHKWCEMNGCAPSSSDLSAARAALEGKKS